MIWEMVWNLVMGLTAGGIANVLTGVGGFLDLSPVGIVDDLITFAFKQWLTKNVEFSFVENLALSVLIQEVLKIRREATIDAQEEDQRREDDTLIMRLRYGVVPSVVGRYDIADLYLTYWSAGTVWTSDLTAPLVEDFGELAVVL